MFLTDDQWSLLQPLFPPDPLPGTRGRIPVNQRLVLDAVLWKISTATPWDLLPPSLPSRETCYRRYRQWQASGLLNRVFQQLHADLLDRGGFDPRQALSDGRVTHRLLGRRHYWVPSEDLNDTWQYRSSLLFYQLALKHIREPHINN